MVLVHGTQTNLNRVGWVGDFCPFCHDFRPLLILQIAQTSTLYTAPVGRSTTMGYLAFCEHCQVNREATPERYLTIHPEPQPIETYLASLKAATLNQLRSRAALEDRRRQNRMNAEDRLELLMEPLRTLEPVFKTSVGHFAMSIGSVVALLCVFAGFITPLASGFSFAGMPPWAVSLLLGFLMLVLLIGSVRRDARMGRRRMLHPLIVAVYAGLNPEHGEMEEATRRLRTEKRAAGRLLDVDQLRADIATTPLPDAPIPSSELFWKILDATESAPSGNQGVSAPQTTIQEQLNEAFLGIARQYEKASSVDGYVLLSMLATFGMIGVLEITTSMPKSYQGIATVIGGIITICMLVLDLRLLMTARRRLLVRRLVPALRQHALNLQASAPLVVDALAYVRSLNLDLGREVAAEMILKS